MPDTGSNLTLSERDRNVLARMIMAEARGESDQGKAAVAWVALNRANATGRPVANIILEPNQFSHRYKPTPREYDQAYALIDKILRGEVGDPTEGAEFFYNPETAKKAKWQGELVSAKTIGRHRFGSHPEAYKGRRVGPQFRSNKDLPSTYTVRRGDTLWRIAKQRLGDSSRWQELAAANNITDPRRLMPGQQLQVPGRVDVPTPRLRPDETPEVPSSTVVIGRPEAPIGEIPAAPPPAVDLGRQDRDWRTVFPTMTPEDVEATREMSFDQALAYIRQKEAGGIPAVSTDPSGPPSSAAVPAAPDAQLDKLIRPGLPVVNTNPLVTLFGEGGAVASASDAANRGLSAVGDELSSLVQYLMGNVGASARLETGVAPTDAVKQPPPLRAIDTGQFGQYGGPINAPVPEKLYTDRVPQEEELEDVVRTSKNPRGESMVPLFPGQIDPKKLPAGISRFHQVKHPETGQPLLSYEQNGFRVVSGRDSGGQPFATRLALGSGANQIREVWSPAAVGSSLGSGPFGDRSSGGILSGTASVGSGVATMGGSWVPSPSSGTSRGTSDVVSRTTTPTYRSGSSDVFGPNYGTSYSSLSGLLGSI